MCYDNIIPWPLEYVREKHNHAAFEQQFVLSGSGTLLFDEMQQPIENASIYLISPNLFHSVKPDESNPVVRSTLRFTFREDSGNDPRFPRTETEQLKAVLSDVTYRKLPASTDHGHLFQLVDEIRPEIETPSLDWYTNVQSLFAQNIVRVARAIGTGAPSAVDYAMPSRAKDDLHSHIIDLFYMGYRQPLTLEMLAEKMNLSTKQVNRLLQRHFRTSFKRKLLDTRLDVAKDLLRTTDLPVEQIAGEIGYA